MGPITIFDKSALEALNVDEAVWFDNFYMTNITPLFLAETLADLEKEVAAGRTQEQVVGSIAYRTPVLHSSPNANHQDAVISNLRGQDVPMDGRYLRAGGRVVNVDGQTGVVFEQAPEMEAMQRWQDGKFLEVEREFAKGWRNSLRILDLEKDGLIFKKAWSGTTLAKNLESARSIADQIVKNPVRAYEVLMVALELFNVPKALWPQVGERWHQSGKPTLPVFAPYAAYVLSVDFFFYLAISAGLISSKRSSNRIDIAYLYYLPFCMVFVSNDKLHRMTAPLFIRDNQAFVWGEDLKADLGRLDAHFSSLPQEVRDLGIMRFASRPPLEGDFLTTALWDRFLSPKWRELSDEEKMKPPPQIDGLAKQISKFGEAKSTEPDPHGIDMDNVDSMIIQRSIPLQRGKWRILPPGIEDADRDN